MNFARRIFTASLAALALSVAVPAAQAEEAKVIDAKVRLAMDQLFAQVPGSRDLFNRSNGVLIMPEVTKAGLIVGGAYGEGALLINGATTGYYSVAAASLSDRVHLCGCSNIREWSVISFFWSGNQAKTAEKRVLQRIDRVNSLVGRKLQHFAQQVERGIGGRRYVQSCSLSG